jgi:hypothetical protein
MLHPADPSLESHIRELEESLLEPSLRKSGRVADLLADGFVEIGSSGQTFTKEQAMAFLGAESTTRYTAADLKVQLLAPDVVLATYRACRHAEPPVFTLRSSIWVQREGQWQILFHQGTPSEPPG